MSKYKEIMNRINLSDESRQSILDNIKAEYKGESSNNYGRFLAAFKTKKNNNRKTLYLPSFIIAFLILAFVFYFMNYSKNILSPPVVNTNHSIVEYSNVKELSKAIGFKIRDIESLKKKSDEIIYTDLFGTGQIIYLIGDDKVNYRKSNELTDNTGDYNNYAYVDEIVVGKYNLSLKGDSKDSIKLFMFNDGKYTYSVVTNSNKGFSFEEVKEMINEIK